MGGLSRGELVRKAGHIGAGAGALLLRPLGPLASAALVLAGLLFVLLVLPRIGGRDLWREEELRRGRSAGIVLYPLAILILVLVFPSRLEI
ncbi:MAG: hypothetical protein R3234_10190, partial [Thermoanaerobaculia bacterium]|nr:hypothetical protein [Thermoanaerobaculia bacterium]